MCKSFNQHIRVIHENDKILYSTTCTDCFQKLLKDPKAFEQIHSKKQGV